jgi:serine phosphatase RsbU (regulator of sigma subunit)
LSAETGEEGGQCWRLAHLARFLDSVGVRELVLDAELESDQVADVLEVLWRQRHYLKGERTGSLQRLLARDKIHAALTSDEGYHAFCADMRLDAEAGRLTVRNSYCQLLFSRVVTAYKKRVQGFKDHRAFFRAAPKYALLTALCVVVPELAIILFGLSPDILLVATPLVAILVGFGTYVVFQTIAAEEYDKEHQAKELSKRHASLMRVYDKIRMDLATARDIQRALLPVPGAQPLLDKVKLIHRFTPEMEVGGDYYDFKRIDDHRVALLLADVSGHGLAAAFVTGLIKTTFEHAVTPVSMPARFMGELNAVLERLTPDSSFAAVLYMVYDTASRVLTYANAGHSPMPMVLRNNDGGLDVLDEPVDLLAGVEPDVDYAEGEARLDMGDRLVLCTDGVPDSVNPKGVRLRIEQVENILREHASEDGEAIMAAVMEAVRAHTGDAEQSDDQTLLVMEVIA